MKGRIFLGLVALPFAGIGVWMLYSIGSLLHDGWAMRDWQPVSATVMEGGYSTSSSDESTTYKAYGTYSYSFGGQRYTGTRVQIAGWADNLGDFQRDLGKRLAAAKSGGQPIPIYVNPALPAQSIVDRRIRWSVVGFKSIFVLLFGGLGIGMLYAAVRAPAVVEESDPRVHAAPWLANNDWQTETIRSTSKLAMWSTWGFAVFWNLVSAPLPFLLYEEVLEKQNHIALVGLLFPIIGIGLAVWAIRRTLEWRRFGPTPVTLDPFPGSIGGNVGGTIDTRLPYNSANRFRVTLSSLYSYMSGSGEDRSRSERALWQEEIVAHTESGPTGTRLVFRFDVPEGLQEADASRSGENYHLWRINLQASLPGTDLDRDFDIPVYATATRSKAIEDARSSADDHTRQAVYDDAARKLVRVVRKGPGKTLIFPAGRQIVSNGAAILIGGTFAAAGWYLAAIEGQRVFGSIFGGVGALVFIAAMYMLFKSLHVTVYNDTITSVRRWFGVPIRKRSMRRRDFVRFEKGSSMQSQSGGKHRSYYKISALDVSGKKIIVGDGFSGAIEVDAGIQLLTRELGLVERDRARFELDGSLFGHDSGSKLASS